MLTPFKLNVHPQEGYYPDPLNAEKCEIEQRIIEVYDLIGGYCLLEFEDIPFVPYTELDKSVVNIYRILGINEE